MFIQFQLKSNVTAIQRQDSLTLTTNHSYTAQLMNSKKALHTIECFFTNVPINDCTLDEPFRLTEHAAGMETFDVQSYQLFCS